MAQSLPSIPTYVVHGLGYVGLTAAVAYTVPPWHKVIGYDPDPEVIATIANAQPRHGGSAIRGLTEKLEQALIAHNLTLTSEWTTDINMASVHLIAVPTEKNGEPWMDLILDVFERICEHTSHPQPLILIESTLVPGTLDRLIALGRAYGKEPGKNYCLAAAPRRDWFADTERNVKTLPRVCGGVTDLCRAAATTMLRWVSDTVIPVGYREAELIKPLENALFHTQIMAAYEVAKAYPHLDMNEVLQGVGSHWRLPQLHLGLGTGGRCVPLGPKYVLHGTRQPLPVMSSALSADATQRYLVARALHKLEGRKLVLGIAYRPDFRDAGSSPALDIARYLSHGRVSVHDPMFSPKEIEQMVPKAVSFPDYRALPFAVRDSVAVVLGCPHRAYVTLGSTFPWQPGQLVVDALGGWAGPLYQDIFRETGVTYVRVGAPGWMEALGADATAFALDNRPTEG